MNTFAPKKLNQFPATKEQIDNMELIKAGNNVKVIAGAGAGKTSSLRYIAKSIPHKNFLVLCFNTANSKESNSHPDKPANVFYSTTHSLAYKSIVTPDFRKKLSFTSVADLFNYNLVKYIPTKNTDGSLKSKDDIKSGVSILYKSISDTITYFCRSDKRSIAAFADNYLKYTFTEVANVTEQPLILTPLAIAGLVADIVDYWDNLTNPKHVAKISHDIYLKLYDLGEFPITQVWDDSVRSFVDIDIVCLDECLTATQTVKTDKGLFRIERLYKLWANKEPLPLILSFNRDTETYEYKQMLSALKSCNRDTLLIKTEGLSKIECTPNHKLLTQRGYIEAASLVIGQDYVLIDNPDNQKSKLLLNADQYQIVLGSFLGDGSLEKRSEFNTYRLRFTQGIAQLEYLTTKAECFQSYELGNIVSGYTGLKGIYTAQSKTFILDYDIWVCLQDLDVKGLAIWYMDDGSLSKANSIIISSNSFTLEEHEVLVKLLQHRFDLTATIGKTRTYYELRFSVPESKKLLELIKDYMHENLDYKNPYSTDCAYKWDDTFKSYGGNFVSSIEYIGKHTVYDIEVADNHNFITTRSIDNYSKGSGILVHNCQDTNPVTDAIFRRQLQQKIIIGDPMQAIYEWRGSTDIMALPYYTNFATGYLTESFRFNQSIADMANIILRKAGSDMQLIGSGTTTEIITKAHICRTNAAVVETIFKYIGTNAKIYATIDFKDTFSKLFHIQSCWFNEVPKYPVKELAHIKNKETLEEAMEVSEDIARLHRLKTALTSDGKSLYAAKLSLDKLLVKEAKDATLTVCTIHSSKGLEYDHVTIDQDILVIRKTESVEEALERLWEDHPLCCLLYVAVTRAKVSVTLPDYLEDVVNK